MDYRVFTLDEANKALDETIKPALERLHGGLKEMRRLEQEARVLALIVDSGAGAASPDARRHREVEDLLDPLRAEIKEDFDAIRHTGAIVKDVRQGLVDFFSLHDGRLVFLCWRRGERSIRYWHTVEGGFQGRRPLGARARRDDV